MLATRNGRRDKIVAKMTRFILKSGVLQLQPTSRHLVLPPIYKDVQQKDTLQTTSLPQPGHEVASMRLTPHLVLVFLRAFIRVPNLGPAVRCAFGLYPDAGICTRSIGGGLDSGDTGGSGSVSGGFTGGCRCKKSVVLIVSDNTQIIFADRTFLKMRKRPASNLWSKNVGLLRVYLGNVRVYTPKVPHFARLWHSRTCSGFDPLIVVQTITSPGLKTA